MRETKVMAKSLREGDVFQDKTVDRIKITELGNVIIHCTDGTWFRRPSRERVKINRI